MKKGGNKKLKLALPAIVLITLSVVLFACNKNPNTTVSGNSGGGGGNPGIEDTQIKIGNIVEQFVEENNFQQTLANEKLECEQDIIKQTRQIVEGSYRSFYNNGRLTTVYKFVNNEGKTQLGSTVFDLGFNASKIYDFDDQVEDLLKAYANLSLLDDEYVSTSKVKEYETKLSSAAEEVLDDINTSQYTAVQTNAYSTNVEFNENFKSQMLSYINSNISDSASKNQPKLQEPVTFGPIRKDNSMVVTGLDAANGQLYQVVLKVKDSYSSLFPNGMTSDDGYSAINRGHGEVVSAGAIRADLMYSDPTIETTQPTDPEKETVSVSELYDQVFAGFKLESIDQILDNLAAKRIVGTDIDVLFTGIDEGKFTLYVEFSNVAGGKTLTKTSYKGNSQNDITKLITLTQEIEKQGVKAYFLKGINNQIVEKGSSLEQEILNKLRENKSNYLNLVNNVKNIQKDDFNYDEFIQKGTATQLNNINQYGEKLLENEEGVEVLKTYLGDWGGRNIDSQHRFDTGYLQGTRACVIFLKDGKINIYNTDIQVPHYIDSTIQSLYQSILNGKFVALNGKTSQVQDAILFEDEAKNTSDHYYILDIPVDLFYEDEANRA